MSTTESTPTIVGTDLRNLIARRLDAAGCILANDVTDGHVMTHFPTLGLIFDVREPPTVRSIAKARAHAKTVDLLDRKGDWVIPDRAEGQIIVINADGNNNVGKHLFPNLEDRGLIYLDGKAPSGCVWFVSLGNGYVYWGVDGNEGFAVPVLRVPVSQ